MAIELLAGDFVLAKEAKAVPSAASFHHFNNPYKAVMDHVTIPAAADIGSTISLARVKPDSVLSALGFLQTAALGASVTLAIGIADDATIGVTGKTAVLNAATDVSSAAVVPIGAAVALANRYKPLWQILGLTEKPSKDLLIVATQAGAASAGGGDVTWEIPFTSY